jgi:hypothetical protein
VQAHPTPSLATRSPNYNPFISKIIGRRLVDDPALRLAKSCILIAKVCFATMSHIGANPLLDMEHPANTKQNSCHLCRCSGSVSVGGHGSG